MIKPLNEDELKFMSKPTIRLKRTPPILKTEANNNSRDQGNIKEIPYKIPIQVKNRNITDFKEKNVILEKNHELLKELEDLKVDLLIYYKNSYKR